MRLKLFTVCSAILLLNSCSSDTDTTNNSKPVFTDKSQLIEAIGPNEMVAGINVDSKLTEAASSVINSMNELAALKIAAEPEHKYTAEPNNQMATLQQETSIDWNGPVEPIMRKIASTGKFKFKVLGTRPTIPVIVSLKMKNSALSDIIRNISYQTSGKAKIAIYTKQKVLELRYNNV